MSAPRIVVTVEAESVSDFIAVLQGLLSSATAANSEGASVSPPAPSAAPSGPSSGPTGEQPNAAGGAQVPPQGAEPPAGGKKRGANKKKEPDAPPPPAQTPAAPTANDVAGMFADIPSNSSAPAQPAAPASAAITKDDLKALGNRHMENVSVDATVKIIQGFKKVDGTPAGKLSEVQETDWPHIAAAFQKSLDASAVMS